MEAIIVNKTKELHSYRGLFISTIPLNLMPIGPVCILYISFFSFSQFRMMFAMDNQYGHCYQTLFCELNYVHCAAHFRQISGQVEL